MDSQKDVGKCFLENGFRWYGGNDPVPLSYIRQAGTENIFSSLHGIPYGELWPKSEIKKLKKKISDAGMRWGVVESLPVSEDIKTRSGDYVRHISNYKKSVENLAACGIRDIIYNFMPVLDWVRTDLHFKLPDGSTCLRYDPAQFAAFEIFILKRKGAEQSYTAAQLKGAQKFYASLSPKKRKEFERAIIDVFPGCKMGLSIADVRKMLAAYDGIGPDDLRENLKLFLREVAPVAEECGARLSIHPDDPPFPVLGLPRIASSLEDFKKIMKFYDSPANSIAFCTGSLSAGRHNDIPKMLDAFKDRVFVAHLRSTEHEADGSFYEAGHLEGSVPMRKVVKKLLEIQRKRLAKGGERIVFRPDHGRDMADDLSKPPTANPGYSYIGRMKGMAELRGLQCGLLNG